MDLKKRFHVTLVVLLLLVILLFSASYAWLSLSLAPEITDIDTNVGANGSLEIALLSDTTYMDPLLIQTKVGDSAAVQDAVDSNLSWGNVVDLSDERYGMRELSLLPAQLNLSVTENGSYQTADNMLNVAEFGMDGRITILSRGTVSAVYQENNFTYYVSGQKYGVRAIGTISNLTSQQKALALARTEAQTYTAAAARTVKNIWRDHGPELMELFQRRYSLETDTCSKNDTKVVRDMALKMQTALEYADLVLRQGMIGIAASQIKDEPDFERLQSAVSNTDIPLSMIIDSAGVPVPENLRDCITRLDEMKTEVLTVIAGCNAFSDTVSWQEVETVLDILVDADSVYLGEKMLSEKDALTQVPDGSMLTLLPESGVMAEAAQFAGNYSAFFRWTETCNIEARTVDPVEIPHLVAVVETLKETSAAVGGWTRANLDDTYGYAMDLAFRCNMETELLLQTVPAAREAGNAEYPQTQGGGSFMRFTSEVMETERLVRLMDTIRIGFLDDHGQLIAVAKLNTSNYEEQEEGVFAPLYLYDFRLDETGKLEIGQRRSEDTTILPLSRNTPTVITAVVWLDGDHVSNDMVGHLKEQSMSGILNLQFASASDLRPSGIPMEKN